MKQKDFSPLRSQSRQRKRLSAVFPKSGAVLAGEDKTPLDKPAVPPWRPLSLKGGGEYATVFAPKSTKCTVAQIR
jgi:hypothetical protein